MSPDELAAWVARSRAAQGLPVKVSDPALVRTVVVLVTGFAATVPTPAATAPASSAASAVGEAS